MKIYKIGKVINIGLIGYGLGGKVFHAPIICSVEGFNLKKLGRKISIILE